MEFRQLIIDNFKKYKIILNEQQLNMLCDYYDILLETNKVMNLTSITEPLDVIIKHYIDCLIPESSFNQNSSVIDVGSGAGFPGLVLKIMRPDLVVTLMDSLLKRVNFLNEVISKLKLTNIIAVHGRCEDLANRNEFREKFDYATARAVAPLNALCEYCLPFVKVNGQMIVYKGEVEQEAGESKKAIALLGGKLNMVKPYKLEDYKRNIVIIDKVNITPVKYPRGQNKVRSAPIK